MFRKICIIGLGSLGSFLCKYLSELDQVKHIVIVDPDIVEPKNTNTSVYSMSDVGEKKINAIEKHLHNNVELTKMWDYYEEGKTILPQCGLVIDCRDIVCPREKEIDIRLYISEHYLVIDCQKKKHCEKRPGSYAMTICKDQIKTAAFFAAIVINHPQIKTLLDNGLVETIDTNSLIPMIQDDIKNILKYREDAIYDAFRGSEKFIQLEETLDPILETNKNSDIEIYIGEPHPIKQFFDLAEKPLYQVIPKGSLNLSTDIIPTLIELTKHEGDMNFVVKFVSNWRKKHVYLIKETGAA